MFAIAEIANLDNFSKSENDAFIKDIAYINSQIDKENSESSPGDKALLSEFSLSIQELMAAM